MGYSSSCEAKALIAHFKLSLCISKPWKVYCDREEEQFLIISGVGPYASAAAVSFLNYYLSNLAHICYLNLGIAGKANARLGDFFQVAKISDLSSGKNFYPHIFSGLSFPLSSVLTSAKIQKEYPADCMVDMEAAAFFSVARKFQSIEKIASFKIISDTSEKELGIISSQFVLSLIENSMSKIIKIVQFYKTLSAQEAKIIAESESESILNKFHFSQYQKSQLEN